MSTKKEIPAVTPEVLANLNRRKPFCVQWAKKNASSPYKESEFGEALVWATESGEAKSIAKQAYGEDITMTAPQAFWKWAVAVMQGRYPNVQVIHGPGEGFYLQGRQQVWEMGDVNRYNEW